MTKARSSRNNFDGWRFNLSLNLTKSNKASKRKRATSTQGNCYDELEPSSYYWRTPDTTTLYGPDGNSVCDGCEI
jgi:hypothetical protein